LLLAKQIATIPAVAGNDASHSACLGCKLFNGNPVWLEEGAALLLAINYPAYTFFMNNHDEHSGD
jgi:hypothetical protein